MRGEVLSFEISVDDLDGADAADATAAANAGEDKLLTPFGAAGFNSFGAGATTTTAAAALPLPLPLPAAVGLPLPPPFVFPFPFTADAAAAFDFAKANPPLIGAGPFSESDPFACFGDGSAPAPVSIGLIDFPSEPAPMAGGSIPAVCE